MQAPPLEAGHLYVVELCSGERRRWQYRGQDARGSTWWRDTDTGLEFNEGSLMYAWSVLGPVPDGPPGT